MNYAEGDRIKIWGRGQVVTNDAELFEVLAPQNYTARIEQAIVFEVKAWDANCTQHILRLFHGERVEQRLATLQQRVEYLELTLAKAGIASPPGIQRRDRLGGQQFPQRLRHRKEHNG